MKRAMDKEGGEGRREKRQREKTRRETREGGSTAHGHED